MGDKTGYGIHIPDLKVNIHKKLTDHLTIYTIELFAIFQALLWIIDYKPDRAVIFSDSLSSLTSIQGYHCNLRPYLLLDILNCFKELANLQIDVWLVWIPAHTGISGNEHADTLAKQATQLPIPHHLIDLAPDEIKPVIKKYLLSLWQLQWDTTEIALFYKTLESQKNQI